MMNDFCNRLIYLVLALNVYAGTTLHAQGATRYWYFGTKAMMEFTNQGVRVGSWPDSSEVAPGVFYGGKGDGLLFITSTRCLDFLGRTVDQGDSPLFGKPLRPYNLPQSIMLYLPGTADTIYSIQSQINPSQIAERSDFRIGALSLSKIDPRGNAGGAAVNWLTDAIIPSYIKTKPTKNQVSACQLIVPNANGRDLWLVVPMIFPQETWILPITSTGIDTSKTIKVKYSFPRPFVQKVVYDPPNDYTGEIKANTSITQIAYVAGNRGRVALFNFDSKTGDLSNELEFSDSTFWKDSASALDPTRQDSYKRYSISPHGIEFSPDGTKIYVTNIQMNGIGIIPPFNEFNPDSARGELVQYDITLPTAEAIRASKQVIVPMSYTNRFGGMQLAPDGKIYITQRELPFVSCIENPNARGTACGFTRNAVNLLPGTRCGEGFPFVMANTLSKNLRVLPQDVCDGDMMLISLEGGFVSDSVRWDFGDASSPSNIGYGKTGKHFYAKQGAYLATATMYIGSEAQKPVSSWVYVHPRPIAHGSAAPQRVCDGDSVTLTATGGITATWFLGTAFDTTNIVGKGNVFKTAATAPGVYSVIVENVFGCLDTTSVLVDVLPAPTVQLTSDTTVCSSQPLTFTPLVSNAVSYSWTSTPGDPSLLLSGPTAFCMPRIDAVYTLTVTSANGCKDSASVRVSVRALPTVVATGDTIICTPRPVQLSARGAASYTWNDAQGQQIGKGATITVTPPRTGIYVVIGTDTAGCENRDTVSVVIQPTVDLTISGDTTLCDGTPSTWTCSASPAGNEQSIVWLDASNARIGNGPTYSALITSTTLLRATLPGATECTDTASVTVHVGTRPYLTVQPMDTTACFGDSVQFVGSNGALLRTQVQAGTVSYPIIAMDSVGCMTTVMVTSRGVESTNLTAAFRDTTVVVGNGEGPLYIDLAVSPHLENGWRGTMKLQLSYQTRSVNVARFFDASTGLEVVPTLTTNVAARTIVELTLPPAQLHAPRQHIIELRALPLVDADTTSTIDVRIVSIEELESCVDSASQAGTLTITGCGRAYYGNIVLGSPTSITVRPNPARETLFVDIDAGVQGTISAQLVDALGRTVSEHSLRRTTSDRLLSTLAFDLSEVASGMHAVVIITPTERRYVPVVVGK